VAFTDVSYCKIAGETLALMQIYLYYLTSANNHLEMFMKLRLSHLAILIALPSAVFAGSLTSFAKDVTFVDAEKTERTIVNQSRSYDLTWDSTTNKFEASAVISGDQLMLNQPTEEVSEVPEMNPRELAI
jgi:hypothetical protein